VNLFERIKKWVYARVDARVRTETAAGYSYGCDYLKQARDSADRLSRGVYLYAVTSGSLDPFDVGGASCGLGARRVRALSAKNRTRKSSFMTITCLVPQGAPIQ